MSRWTRLLRRKHTEEQLDKELRFHLEQHAADLIARGRPAADAWRLARLELGGQEQVKESVRDVRGTRWLEDLAQDGRHAVRALGQHPGFAAVALLTLALGTGATTTMFTVMNSVLFKPLPYPGADRLVSVHERTERYGEQRGFSYPNFLDCRNQARSLESMAAWTYGGGTVGQAGDSEYVSGREISAGLFAVLGVPLLRGRTFVPEEDRPGGAPAVILGERLWRRRHAGNPAVVGQALAFNGKTYTVVGIAPASVQLDGDAELFTPLAQNTTPRMGNRAANFLRVWARLRPDVTVAQAQAELALIGRRLAVQYPVTNAGRDLTAQSLRQEMVGDIRPTLWLLFGAVALVLLIACVNVASLLLARAVSRDRELAMRVALGASRGRLVRQCLTESAVLALAGGGLGVLVAALGTQPFLALWPGGLPRAGEVGLSVGVLVFALVASLASGVVFGLAPALRAPVRDIDRTIRGAARTVAGGSRRVHGGLVVSEIALAIVLLVAAAMLGRTLLRLSSLDPGINPRGVLISRLAVAPAALDRPDAIRSAWQDVLDGARRVPGVQAAALADIIPMRVGLNALGYWTTAAPPPASRLPIALATSATPDYLRVMGIPLKHGRFFDEHDRVGSEPVVVIDEVLARNAFGSEDPVGKRLFVQAVGPNRVIGVVGHVRHWGLASDDVSRVRDQIYYPLAQVPDSLLRLFSSVMSVAIRTDVAPLSIVERLRKNLRGEGGDQTLYELRTMEQLTDASLDQQRFLLLVFGVFAGVALVLACVGLYGVLAYLTGQRVPEIGVRMALGASAHSIVWLVLRQSVVMIVLGVGIGVLAAWGAERLLGRVVEGTQPGDPMAFVIVIPVLVASSLLASLLPARRASRVDPLSALRQD